MRGQSTAGVRPAPLLIDAARLMDNLSANAPMDAEREVENLERLAQALEEARQEGFKAGAADTRARVGEEIEAREANRAARFEGAMKALREAVDRLDEVRTDAVAVAQKDSAALAYKLTQVIVGRELRLSENPTIEAIHRALSLVPGGEQGLVKLNPQDFEVLSAYDLSDLGDRFVLEPDEGVESGGAIVEVGPTRIDAQIGQALARVRKVLQGMDGSEAIDLKLHSSDMEEIEVVD